jgi:hypothetical protein
MVVQMALVAILSAGNAEAAGGWTCSAIGYEPSYGGTPGRRRDVYGPEMPTQASAQTRAVQACMASGLLMCGVGSCSQLPFAAAE